MKFQVLDCELSYTEYIYKPNTYNQCLLFQQDLPKFRLSILTGFSYNFPNVPAFDQPAAAIFFFMVRLFALQVDVDAARLLCAEHFATSISADFRTTFNQRAIVSFEIGLDGWIYLSKT